jgi:hypothetical protein
MGKRRRRAAERPVNVRFTDHAMGVDTREALCLPLSQMDRAAFSPQIFARDDSREGFVMSDFDEAVERERLRLQGLISEAEEKIGELNAEVSIHRRRIEALDAYDRIKTGKAAGKTAAKKAPRSLKDIAVRPPAPSEADET